MKQLMRLAAIGSLLGCSVTAVALEGDAKAGKYAFSTCSGCHAIPGYQNAYPSYHVPRLGGQHPEYIVAALQAYKAGLRGHATMHANAASLTDADMTNIAVYLGGFAQSDDIGPVWGDAAKGKEKSAACTACHGPDGNSPAAMFPKIAGQYQDYLSRALHDYKSGTRENAIMLGIAQLLSDQDIEDLSAYYASQQPALSVIEYSGSD